MGRLKVIFGQNLSITGLPAASRTMLLFSSSFTVTIQLRDHS